MSCRPFGALGRLSAVSLALSLVTASCKDDSAGPSAPASSDAGADSSAACNFDPSTYGTTCQVDSDCVAVPQGDVCTFPCERACPTGAVNVSASSRYLADVTSRTGRAATPGVCHCPALAVAPCCRGGTCSNSAAVCSTPMDGSDAMILPEAFVSATLGPHGDSNNINACLFGSTRQVLTVGTLGSVPPVLALDGSSQGGAMVSVSCSVATGFHVSLQVALGGPMGGTLTISGNVDGSSGGTGIAADLVSTDGEFAETDCTVSFTFVGQPVPAMPPIAQGRIWAHLACSKMVNVTGATVQLMDGTSVPETCDGEVDFVFENCGW